MGGPGSIVKMAIIKGATARGPRDDSGRTDSAREKSEDTTTKTSAEELYARLEGVYRHTEEDKYKGLNGAPRSSAFKSRFARAVWQVTYDDWDRASGHDNLRTEQRCVKARCVRLMELHLQMRLPNKMWERHYLFLVWFPELASNLEDARQADEAPDKKGSATRLVVSRMTIVDRH
jgi:hypothetical protein